MIMLCSAVLPVCGGQVGYAADVCIWPHSVGLLVKIVTFLGTIPDKIVTLHNFIVQE